MKAQVSLLGCKKEPKVNVCEFVVQVQCDDDCVLPEAECQRLCATEAARALVVYSRAIMRSPEQIKAEAEAKKKQIDVEMQTALALRGKA